MFVPADDHRIAAVLGLPETDPRALVVFLQGLGAPRSHKNRMWTRMARDLAGRGIASVRFDYPEVGDSTGTLDHTSPADDALGVAEFAMRAAGVERFGAIGNCRGIRMAVDLAHRTPACTSLGLLLLGSPKQVLVRGGQTPAGSLMRNAARKTPRLRRRARALLHTERRTPRFRLLPEVASAMGSADALFLFLGRADLGDGLRRLVSEEAGGGPRRAEVRTEEVLGTSGFRIPASHQPFVIDAFVEWMDRTLPGPVRAPASSAGRST
jgi:hypothetical protein